MTLHRFLLFVTEARSKWMPSGSVAAQTFTTTTITTMIINSFPFLPLFSFHFHSTTCCTSRWKKEIECDTPWRWSSSQPCLSGRSDFSFGILFILWNEIYVWNTFVASNDLDLFISSSLVHSRKIYSTVSAVAESARWLYILTHRFIWWSYHFMKNC